RAHRACHVTLAYERQAGPVAKTAGLRDAAPDIGQRQAANQRAVRIAGYKKGITLVAAQILGIAFDAAAECRAREIVDRPGWLPRLKKIAAHLPQRRPFLEVGHLRGAQGDPLAFDARQRLRKIDGAEESHWLLQPARSCGGAARQSLRNRRCAFKSGTKAE